MNITIVLPFADAARLTPRWAHEEARIDFHADAAAATRCTVAFAACELKHFLGRTLRSAEISFASATQIEQLPQDGFLIELQAGEDSGVEGSFRISKTPAGMRIEAPCRIGVLNGAYEFLQLQGWRWYAPGAGGEVAPAATDRLTTFDDDRTFEPSMSLGRGFDFEYRSMESAEFFLWMARNRLNLATPRGSTTALCRKLGMELKTGGHIFETILDPQRPMPSGRTLWEEHPHWYGLPSDAERTMEKALHTQFCVSQPDLLQFLGCEILDRLGTVWKDADRIDIWGFDTWGSCCSCSACQELGNASDQALHLLASLRGALNEALASGELARPVRLVVCCYEGTGTLQPPLNSCPQSLLQAGDYGVYYPINRCYAHDLEDSACAMNLRYREALDGWLAGEPALPMMIGEYYNVSKFEDLPLLFTTRLAHDLPAYHRAGVRGCTYMHVPLVNWGMRTVTQWLYAQLAWNVDADVDALLNNYFNDWHGPHADAMRAVYEDVEEAWLFSASWRAWSFVSVLSRLLVWDGARPQNAFLGDAHFRDAAAAVDSGRRSIALLASAYDAVAALRASVQQGPQEDSPAAPDLAVNPVEAGKRARALQELYEARLGEDWRSLRYGLDTMILMTEFVAYYDSLFSDDAAAAHPAWEKIEGAAASLDSYYVPIAYEHPGAGLLSQDGLTRSQLRPTIARCRQQRRDSQKQ